MAAHIPTSELAPKPGHSGHALAPMGIASGIPRMSTSTMSSTIPNLIATDRLMARSMLAGTRSLIYPRRDCLRGTRLGRERRSVGS